MPIAKKIKKTKHFAKEKIIKSEIQDTSAVLTNSENSNESQVIKVANNSSQDVSKKSKKLSLERLFWTLIPVYLIVFAIGGGFYIFMQGLKKIDQEKVNKEPKIITEKKIQVYSPTPTILKTVNLKQYKIQILNGSGVEGAASKTKLILEKEGFLVTSIGNASDKSNKSTVLSHKKNVDPNFIDKLKETLAIDVVDVNEVIESDIEIILGTND